MCKMTVFINFRECVVFYSQWVRDGLSFERLNSSEKRCPAEEQATPPIQEQEEDSSSTEAIKVNL